MDHVIDDVIAQHRAEGPAALDKWTVRDLLEGLVLMTPLAKVVMPKKKAVFDKVWSRRKEWYDDIKPPHKSGSQPSVCTLVAEPGT